MDPSRPDLVAGGKSWENPEWDTLEHLEMEQEIHKTHRKDDSVVERNLLESLEELGITGVWNNSSEAIQGVAGCFLVTVVWRRGHRNRSVLQPSSSFLVSISASSSLLPCPPISTPVCPSSNTHICPGNTCCCP